MSNRWESAMNFDRARQSAFFKRILAIITGQPTDLLSFDQIRRAFHLHNQYYRGLQQVPLDKIIGSVGRYRDFTREFLPLTDEMRERWVRVEQQTKLSGLPPIELYKVGEIYFVRDGNHRVSVARANDMPDIEAYVWEFPIRVEITPDMSAGDIQLQEGKTEFLEKTKLDSLRPQSYIRFTEPGRYRELLEHIDVHRYFIGQKQGREIPYREAVLSWYDNVYIPAVDLIREQKTLERFPGRTEADLYIWLSRWFYELGQQYHLEEESSLADQEESQG